MKDELERRSRACAVRALHGSRVQYCVHNLYHSGLCVRKPCKQSAALQIPTNASRRIAHRTGRARSAGGHGITIRQDRHVCAPRGHELTTLAASCCYCARVASRVKAAAALRLSSGEPGLCRPRHQRCGSPAKRETRGAQRCTLETMCAAYIFGPLARAGPHRHHRHCRHCHRDDR